MRTDKDSVMDEVFFALCKSVDSAVSLGAWLRYKYSHTELASMDIDPRDYCSIAEFQRDYSVVCFLSKYKGLDTGLDLEKTALLKFTLSESQCKDTNERFRKLASVRNGHLHGVLHSAQRKIAKLLGPFSMFCVSEGYGWGPGATTDIPRRRAFVDTKMSEVPISVSRTALSSLRNEIEHDLHWSWLILGWQPEGPFCLLPSVFVLQDECRIDTVPKNAKTHRVIAVEPRGNSFLQKGYGAYFRQRLRSVGINLDDQTTNQDYARRAWSESLATLDLRAASDTVSKEVVYSLLPYDWAAALDAVRSRRASMPDGSSIVLEKFSSMGNGFTFELETLIFWAISSAVSEASLARKGVVAVYGDDIIVDASVATDVCLTLQFCGFEVNDQKSFLSGCFYESCGKHYFQGTDVTPAYQKEVLDSVESGIRCGNRLIRLAFRLGGRKFLDSRLRPAWSSIRRNFGMFHLAIPFSDSGDDGWSVPYSEFPWPRDLSWHRRDKEFNSGMGIRCKVLHVAQQEFPGNEPALLAWSLRSGSKAARPRSWKDELPDPYLGNVKFVPRLAKPRESHRRVIPAGVFSVIWQ